MDSLTISPSILRRATMPDDLLLGDTMFEWDPQATTTHSLSHAHVQQQTLSPPDMEMAMAGAGGKINHHPPSQIHKTPVRQRASSTASSHHSFPEMFEDDKGFVDNKGLVTPISIGGTPASYWAGQKLEFMATPRTEHDYHSAYNTPLATPVPLVPRSPLFDKQSPVSGTNPFYNPPLCMCPSTTPTPLASPNIDLNDKVKAASAAEEALANFSEPNRERALSESDAGRPEKPFGCSHCTKTFRRMEHLRRHIKIHTKERPYSCEIPGCGRKFSRNDNLKAHMKTHAKPTGRNIYVEGLEIQEVQATPKRRRVE